MAKVPKTDARNDGQHVCIRVLRVGVDSALLNVFKQIMELDQIFEVDLAFSVEEAFSKLANKTYDAIVSEYEMPQKDGLQFLKELRQAKNSSPFFFFTLEDQNEIPINLINLGCTGYIRCVGDPEAVFSKLSNDIIRSVRQAKKVP